MYNDFEIGSYLLFQGYPRYRVFVDPRLPAYPEDIHRLLGSFDLDRDTWDDAMAKYGVETALLAYAGVNRRVSWWEPRNWALVYRASDARVFVRRREKWRALIAAHEIPATFDFSVEQGTTTLPLEIKPVSSPVPECEWQRRLGDLCFDLDRGNTMRARRHYERALAVPDCLAAQDEAALAAWMGALQLRASDWKRSVAYLDRALELSPNDAQTRANRATALERIGRREEAAADWIRVASQARGTPLGAAAAARSRALGSLEEPQQRL
jgi:tetratricopeptide (TPR) repeat protein